MLIRLDPSSGLPIYDQLSAGLRRAIRDGDVAAGDRLPAARDLAGSLGVNMHTVLRAYRQLRDEGLIDLRRGRGAVVCEGSAGPAGLRTMASELAKEARHQGVTLDEVVQLIREELT